MAKKKDTDNVIEIKPKKNKKKTVKPVNEDMEKTFKAGRKGYYDDFIKPKLSLVQMWARDGVPHDEIAKGLNIAYSTLYKYAREHEEFRDVLDMGKFESIAKVENCLMKSCEELNFKSIEFYLCNKAPDKWASKQKLEVTGTINVDHTILQIEQLRKEALIELTNDPELIELVGEETADDEQ